MLTEVVTQSLANPLSDLVLGHCPAILLFANDESSHHFAVSLVWNTNNGHIGHAGAGKQTVLDL
jgi:ABC-type uncharacterized transport system ATPase subunit